MTETTGHRLIRQVDKYMLLRNGKYVIPAELAMEIKSHFDEKRRPKNFERARKLTTQQAAAVKNMRANGAKHREIAKHFKVSYKTIWNIINNVTYNKDYENDTR